MSLIEKLTPEQEALIPVYREKWRAIALSTERIDREKAANVVKAAYVGIGCEEPEIIFCDSPNAVFESYLPFQEITLYYEKSGRFFTCDAAKKLHKRFYEKCKYFLKSKKYYQQLLRVSRYYHIPILLYELYNPLYEQLSLKWYNQLHDDLRFYTFEIEQWAYLACDLDLYFSISHPNYIKYKYQFVQSLVKECGVVFAFEKVAIICDRPLHLRFDNENRLHAEGEPAIEFTDGYSLYSYHGITLPEKYGKIHPQRWQSQWLLTEENAELRRVLIQGIGYARICQELQAIELDNWQEYTLLKIDNDVDEEPIYLLKMTCPSTSFIHALRVPPNMKSAREAIGWVNWGVEPEAFGVQT
ncbi:DUF6745 domain-containing protein [Nostoc sp.]|uniref:DUF6745 domain-containing protein n=1 Tax=Nostoc sp. TaxID=1180 RepID=UPI002FEF763D